MKRFIIGAIMVLGGASLMTFGFICLFVSRLI